MTSAAAVERHFTTDEVAALLAVSPETIRRLAARGKLRFVRVAANLRFPESAILDYLSQQTGARR
jgi:excisionase family DNA binding protein